MTDQPLRSTAVCPVCGRPDISVAPVIARPLFRPHSDGVGRICPMSGEPVPTPEVVG